MHLTTIYGKKRLVFRFSLPYVGGVPELFRGKRAQKLRKNAVLGDIFHFFEAGDVGM